MTPEEITAMAIWKPIPNFPGYEVSSLGQVRRGNRLLAIGKNVSGYPRVTLSVGGRSVSRVVHALVAEAFIGPRPNGLQVRHLDGSKNNNRPCNLVYGTAAENAADKALHGTSPVGLRNGAHTKPHARPRGSKHGKSVLTEEQVRLIKGRLRSWEWGLCARLSEEFGVSEHVISKIRTGRTWGHV